MPVSAVSLTPSLSTSRKMVPPRVSGPGAARAANPASRAWTFAPARPVVNEMIAVFPVPAATSESIWSFDPWLAVARARVLRAVWVRSKRIS